MEGTRERFGTPKRYNTHTITAPSSPYSPISSPKDSVKFRILCLRHQVDVMIGEGGSTIATIGVATKSRISVLDTDYFSSEYVILIIENGKVGSRTRLNLGVINGEEEEEIEISKAQDALIRVFEIVKENIGTDTVRCRLLIETSDVDALKDKDDEAVERIREQTGCKVEIKTRKLPSCTDFGDAMVEIEGNGLAVKKALVSISSRLQAIQRYNPGMAQNFDRDFQEDPPRPDEINPHDYRPRTNHPTAGYSPRLGQRFTTMDDAGRHQVREEASSQLQASPSPRGATPIGAYDGNGGLSSTRASPGLGSRRISTIVTKHTGLPETVVKFLCREEGGHNRLQEMRQISGAKVIFKEPNSSTEKNEWTIAISGTYDQTETAEELLDAYVNMCNSSSVIERLRLKGNQR